MPAELTKRVIHVSGDRRRTRVVVAGPVRDAVRAHAGRTLPEEACGLLVGWVDGEEVRVTRSVPCPNQAPEGERHHRFSIDPRAVLNVRRTLRGSAESIVGFYHSHPDGRAVPSVFDLEHIRLWPETVWLIVPMMDQQAHPGRAWWLDAGETEVRELPIRVAALSSARMTCPE